MRQLVSMILIFISFQSLGQNTKYKDIVPMIEGTSDDYTMEVLKAFLAKNLDHPAANLKLAALYLKKAKETDPLIEYQKTQALAEQSKQKLFKSSVLLNAKEIKKNDDYYLWIAKQNQLTEVNFELVRQHLKSENEEIKKILKTLPLVYSDFTNAVDYYDKAVKNFANISNSYPSLKNLYLLYDDKLSTQFSELKSDYDSSLFYFNNYKTKIDTFALKGYNQTMSIKPINVFRYDGLVTQINFLYNEVDVWNYGAWVDTVNAVINGDIGELRTLLKTNEERQTKALENLAKSTNLKDANVVKVDKSLVFNLLRFDYNNPVVPLLKYKESKQKLLIEESNSTYFDTANIEIERKLIFYNKMVYQIKDSDSIITQFKNRFNAIRMAKYKQFLDTHYNGIDGSSQYMANEKNELRKELNIYGALLREGVESIKPIDSIGVSIRYKKMQIPLIIEKIDTALLATGVLFTTHIIEAPDGGYYLAGQHKPNKKLRNTKVYLLKLSNQKRLKWFQQYDVKIDSVETDSNNSLEGLSLTNEGVALLIRSNHISNESHANSLIQVLLDGNTKNTKRLDSSLFPRSLMYNEVQNSFIICNNGENGIIEDNAKNSLELKTLNSLGEISWTYSDSNIGSIVGVVRTDNGYIITRNSNAINSSKVLLTKIDFEGTKQGETLLNVGENAHIDRVYKLTDASIHLIGHKTYQMINAKLEKIYPY